jgi:hypothetical protein
LFEYTLGYLKHRVFAALALQLWSQSYDRERQRCKNLQLRK